MTAERRVLYLRIAVFAALACLCLYGGGSPPLQETDEGFAANWDPTPHLSRGAVRDLQLKMQKAGYDVGKPDGLIGFKTRRSIGEWQEKNGMAATCFPDAKLVKALK